MYTGVLIEQKKHIFTKIEVHIFPNSAKFYQYWVMCLFWSQKKKIKFFKQQSDLFGSFWVKNPLKRHTSSTFGLDQAFGRAPWRAWQLLFYCILLCLFICISVLYYNIRYLKHAYTKKIAFISLWETNWKIMWKLTKSFESRWSSSNSSNIHAPVPKNCM